MKMETPKMDVVRFQEADVLAASGFATKFATLGAWGIGTQQDDSGKSDGWASYNGAQAHTYSELVQLSNEQFVSGSTFYVGNSSTTISELLANDAKDADDTTRFDGSIFNGNYTSTDNGITYRQ